MITDWTKSPSHKHHHHDLDGDKEDQEEGLDPTSATGGGDELMEGGDAQGRSALELENVEKTENGVVEVSLPIELPSALVAWSTGPCMSLPPLHRDASTLSQPCDNFGSAPTLKSCLRISSTSS